jgi:aldose sugar dehydrogenase
VLPMNSRVLPDRVRPPPARSARPTPRARWTLALPMLALVSGCSSSGSGPEAPGNPTLAQASESSPIAVRVVTVAQGLEHPWGLAFLPNGEGILVTERPGRLRLMGEGGLLPDPISGIPQVHAQGQGGLLDVALHPEFARTRWVYLTYSKPGARGATTALARGRLEGGELVDTEDLFVADAWDTGGRHFGSRIVFDGSGHLYLTVGDRGEGGRAGDPRDHAGTTLRLLEDGGVPGDNPFRGVPDIQPQIFSYGHRNAQGMAIHPETGAIWQHEHGPRGGDELHMLRRGGNYGWPDSSFGNHYNLLRIPDPDPRGDTELPLLHWTPSIAPSGMTFYTGDAFPQWRGDLFVGALAGRHLQRIRFEGITPVAWERLLEDRGQRIRDVRTGPDGLLYLLVDAGNGELLRLEPDDTPPNHSPRDCTPPDCTLRDGD